MIPLGSVPSPWPFERGAADDAGVTLISAFHGIPLTTSFASKPHYLDPSPRLAPINETQFEFDPVDPQDFALTFPASNLPFDPNGFDAAFQPPFDQARGSVPWISPMFTEEPATNDVQATWSPTPSSYGSSYMSYTSPTSQSSSSSQDTEDSFQMATYPSAFPLGGISPQGWVINRLKAASSPPENSFNFNSADLGIDSSSYPRDDVQTSPLYPASPPFELQFVLSERPVGHCKWTNEDGTPCGEELTRGGLPGHLSKHGIKNMGRDKRTKCNWLGCKRKKLMNRESILRHTREAHLGLKRPPSKHKPAPKVLATAQTPVDALSNSSAKDQVRAHY